MSSIVSHEKVMTFYDYLFVIKNRWKFIFYNILLMFSVSVIISLIMPKTFKASTVLMPPKSQSEFGLLGALSGLPMSDLLIKPDDDTMDIIAILKSRTLMEDVIDKFDFDDKKTENREEKRENKEEDSASSENNGEENESRKST